MNGRSCFPTREGKFDYQYMDRCEAVTVALAGMVIEKLSHLPDFVGLGSHLYRSPGGDKVQPAI